MTIRINLQAGMVLKSYLMNGWICNNPGILTKNWQSAFYPFLSKGNDEALINGAPIGKKCDHHS